MAERRSQCRQKSQFQFQTEPYLPSQILQQNITLLTNYLSESTVVACPSLTKIVDSGNWIGINMSVERSPRTVDMDQSVIRRGDDSRKEPAPNSEPKTLLLQVWWDSVLEIPLRPFQTKWVEFPCFSRAVRPLRPVCPGSASVTSTSVLPLLLLSSSPCVSVPPS